MSIRHLKAVHTATHPGRFGQEGQHVLEVEPEPSTADLRVALEREAEDEGEDDRGE